MKLFTFLAFLLSTILSYTLASATADNGKDDKLKYEYIVVGSGAGGGPLACRLAMAGRTTLLIEAGNDQIANINISVPAYWGLVAEDLALRWDMFVNHYQDQTRAKRDPKYTWETAPYQYYVGPNPPLGAKPRGIMYPRATTLGGSATHNALVLMTPFASDWNDIATLTNDPSWSATNMDKYLNKLYQWLPVQPADPGLIASDFKLAQHLAAGADAIGSPLPINGTLVALQQTLSVDANNRRNANRDSTQGLSHIPLTMKNGVRSSVRNFIADTVARSYPLTVRTNCHATKILFEKSKNPKATGVAFLDGKYLYRASPNSGSTGTPGAAYATREVIIAGGAFNTPQLLKLSGIGDVAELTKFNILPVKHLPGVGLNLQDRYEIPVNVRHGTDFVALTSCTFDGKAHDDCLTRWKNNPNTLAGKGAYGTIGLGGGMLMRSNYSANTDVDFMIFGGPIDFRGYYPGFADDAVANHQTFTWGAIKAHTRNRAGTVELRSANPLDTPLINFNHFDTGTTEGGADNLDLMAMVEALNKSRQALRSYAKYNFLGGDAFTELQPGPAVQSTEDLKTYIKDRAWGHHASCSAPIGADNDPKAVLDSKFRVRGIKNLRVVDASVFPRIPGIFIQAAVYMMSEKAADTILNG